MGRENQAHKGPLDAKRGARPEGLDNEMYGERNIDGWVPRNPSVWPYRDFSIIICLPVCGLFFGFFAALKLYTKVMHMYKCR